MQIDAAYYGDEKSFTNVTKSILSKVNNGYVNTVVSSALKPQFERTTGAALTPQDQDEVNRRAIVVCGTAADTKCMQGARLRVQQEILKEREREATSGANMIKGNRLTVEVRDAKGARKQIIVPENQTFKLENVITGDVEAESFFPAGNVFYTRLWEYTGIFLGVMFYILGILIPYAIFMREAEKAMVGSNYDRSPKRPGESFSAYAIRVAGPGATWRTAAYVTAFLSAIVPYSGLIFTLMYYGGQSFVREYTR